MWKTLRPLVLNREITRVLRTNKFPKEASCRWVWAHWSVKLHQEIQTWILIKPPDASPVLGQINDLISSIYLQCTCTHSRILAVQVSRRSLQSQFTEFLSGITRFTGTKNGRSRRHENKLAPLFIPMVFGGCVFPILLPRYCDGCPMSSNFGWDELWWRRPDP